MGYTSLFPPSTFNRSVRNSTGKILGIDCHIIYFLFIFRYISRRFIEFCVRFHRFWFAHFQNGAESNFSQLHTMKVWGDSGMVARWGRRGRRSVRGKRYWPCVGVWRVRRSRAPSESGARLWSLCFWARYSSGPISMALCSWKKIGTKVEKKSFTIFFLLSIYLIVLDCMQIFQL